MSDRAPTVRSRPRRRSGVLLPAALLACFACALILLALVGQVVRRVQTAKTMRYRSQCEWLVVSGLQRARLKLAEDPRYAGETWRLAAARPLPYAAEVAIRVERVDGQAQLEVAAAYPLLEGETIRRRILFRQPVPVSGQSHDVPSSAAKPGPEDRPPAPFQSEKEPP